MVGPSVSPAASRPIAADDRPRPDAVVRSTLAERPLPALPRRGYAPISYSTLTGLFCVNAIDRPYNGSNIVGYFFAFDAETGELLWKLNTGAGGVLVTLGVLW